MIEIREDDAAAPHVAALIAYHRTESHADTPPGFRHSLGPEALAAAGVTFWTAWRDGTLAGIGALRDLGGGEAELKSMRTAPDHLRHGIARALLETIVATARARGHHRLNLETGTAPSFVPANALYERAGFVDRDAFGGYPPSPHNRFMTLPL